MAEVQPAQVAELLAADAGSPDAAIPIVTAMAKAYTRGRGFTDEGGPNAEVSAVIITASARLVANTRQTAGSTTTPDVTVDRRSYFTGWTLAEQIVLNRYRVRAM